MSISEGFPLHAICRAVTNQDGDTFVGIKFDSQKLWVCFPLEYNIPVDERELRQDIVNLIDVLSRFTEKRNYLLPVQTQGKDNINFPIQAYMTIINDFFANNYYTESEVHYQQAGRGKIDWKRTIATQKPYVQDRNVFYTQFMVKNSSVNDENLISQIHEYCVYESFAKIGWLFFTAALPRKPRLEKIDASNKEIFSGAVREKLGQTNNDKHKSLFNSMIAMINYLGENDILQQFYFGTTHFEYVWEKLIDFTFGIRDKQLYFPKTSWSLKVGRGGRNNPALEPDTIMVTNVRDGLRNYYVLDAKYYRFGETHEVSDLPASSSINKQITYGEYIHTHSGRFNAENVYNAFLMPYNKQSSRYIQPSVNLLHIGEATGDWKTSTELYTHVQGILVDVRYLMHQYSRASDSEVKKLAKLIEENARQNLRVPTSTSAENAEEMTPIGAGVLAGTVTDIVDE